MARLRSRFDIVLTALLVAQTVALPALADDPKTHLAAGEKAARAKDWAKALEEYDAANAAQPSADAQAGVANAQYQRARWGDAYAAYDQYVKLYGATAPKPKRAAADARLKELGDKTGQLTLEISEPGATVTVDGAPAGTSPLAAPLRLSAGPHRVRVTKEGFLPSDQLPNVIGGGAAVEKIALEAQSSKGRLAVRERTRQAVRVFVDGVDMGDAPWSGEVAAGDHEVRARSATLSAPPQKIAVERGKTRDVEVIAQSSTAQLRVVIQDGKGTIYLDDKLVGEGQFTSDIPAGPHKLRVMRDGYDPFDRDIVLEERQPALVSVNLQLASKVKAGAIQKEARRVEGVYGGFGLMGTTQPGGMKSSMAKLCTAGDRPAALTGCDEGGGLGAGLSGFIGYHWDPVGVELFFAGQYDSATPTLTWASDRSDPGVAADPARTEEFTVRRVGGLGAARVRLTFQGEKLRFSVAGGAGLAYRALFMERDARAAANAQFRDAYVPGAETYLSPVLSLEPSVQYRLGQAVAVALGVTLLVENPGAFDQVPTTKLDGSRTVGPSGVSTPAYDLATNTQLYLGPFIGMMFGP